MFSKVTPWALLSNGFKDLAHPPASNRPYLDVLRTLAIALVFFYHLQGSFQGALLTLRSPVVQFGWSGVDLFFVLSGILIGGQLWRELKASGTVDVGRFILRRGFRIWPLYYTVVAFLLAERLCFGQKREGLWLDATFLANYFPTHHQVGGGWSLCTEEQFYLLIPILLAIAVKFVSPKRLLGLVLTWLVALPIIRYFVMRGMSDPEEIHNAVYFPFHVHSDGLAVGLLIAWIMTWKPGVMRLGRWLDVVLVLVCVGTFAFWYRGSLALLYLSVGVSYGALALLLLRFSPPSIFRWRIFYVISRLSYGVYLLHLGLLKHVMPYHTRLFGHAFPGYVAAFFLWGAVALGLAFITFSFVELPFLRMRAHLLAENHGEDRSPRAVLKVRSASAV
jgi:peptidoglycan/LPS O-acetylase OafA/YrhL